MPEKKTTKTTTGTRTKPKQTTKGKSTTNKAKTATKANKNAKDKVKGNPDIEVLSGNIIDIMEHDKKATNAKPEEMTFDIEPPMPKLPIARKNRNSPVIGDNGIDTKPGDNAKYATVLMELASWDKPDKTDVIQLDNRFMEYLQYCASNDIKIGNQMAYLALGLNKDDVYDMEHGRKLGSSASEFIKKVKQICAGNRELLMQDGKVNPITGIFWQKNYDAMKDVQDLQITASNALQPTMTMEEIAEKVKSDVVIDVDYE